ncbi:MAG: hypothetical protein ACK2T4_06740 [Candidatus Promineifilaceae bacterium]|jgi:hypothetical protein
MTTSFNTLINQISYEISDSTWDNAFIGYWINMAIRDYSKCFPLVKVQTINCADDDKDYDLAVDFMGVLAVEYPAGEDPKVLLSRLPITHPDFGRGESWYDIIEHGDDTDPNELIISAASAAGEDINVTYHAHHALIANPASPSGNCTVPVFHHNLLTLYVVWQNALALTNNEQQSPTSNSSLLMAQLAQNARRAENAYHVALQQAIYAARGKSQAVLWIGGGKDDGLARIY